MSTPDQPQTFFAVVIGTGFAGAVTACRLVEAGFDICVLERGRRYGPDDFPRYPSEELFSSGGQDHENFAPPPDFSRWLWSRDHGVYDVRDLDEALSVQAAGYGGGSLIYANVHLRPPRELFEQGWPKEYRQQEGGTFPLEPYFDLAAHMLQVSRVPRQLAKTLQLEDAARALDASGNWFRTPLAINFDERSATSCDMRGRCCVGCDRGAKNTLDLNYLARAEYGNSKTKTKPDIRTLAEVTQIDFDEATETFTVTYNDLLFRSEEAPGEDRQERSVRAKYVFLCAGSISTTELLMKNPHLWDKRLPPSAQGRRGPSTPLGSHYFPNADSLAAIFDCDHPHEADYGPTITSSLLYQDEADKHDEFRYSLDFRNGRVTNGRKPAVGAKVRGLRSGAIGDLSHPPLLDWGTWTTGAAGALVLKGVEGHFTPGEDLDIGGQATATARSTEIVKTHWFMAQDGGYPPDLEPLIGVFRSPIWLRRNRYIVSKKAMQIAPPPRRSATQRLNVPVVTDSLRATAGRAGSSGGLFDRVFDPTRFRATELFSDQLTTFFPTWFIDALRDDHKDLLAQAAAAALPMVGRLLGELSKTVAQQLDTEMVAGLIGKGGTVTVTDDRKQVLIRGMLRLALQVFAGSEAAVASKATTLLLDPVPHTPEGLLRVIGGGLLWALAYGSNEGHTGLVLTMGRDLYRGRLSLVGNGAPRDRRLTARLPGRLLDSSSVMQERVLRVIARKWGGELRTNPSWAVLGKRVTVHNQGGCPMGSDPETSVTSPWGDVHKCPGLYVMDASAFPTSVGVNPSATIAAVAEFKIERFIRAYGPRNETWADDRRRDKDDATSWVDDRDRAAIDPLNHNKLSRNRAPALKVLGLTFSESMEGALYAAPGPGTDFDDPKILNGFRKKVGTFIRAEDNGTRQGSGIDVSLTATVSDLARLISPEPGVEPVRILLSGSVTFRDLSRPGAQTHPTYDVIPEGSYMQLFVRPPREETPPLRFFRYKVRFMEDGHVSELNGLKVLCDSPGFDVWSDTSTLYFEISGGKGLRRGVLRISVNRFQDQLQSIAVTGTGDPNDLDDKKGDPARKSWALVAFYRYFIGELVTVYVRRPDALKDLLVKVISASYV